MLTGTGKLSLAATILLLGVASGSPDTPFLNEYVGLRRQQASCHNLFFNIKVTLQGIGDQCGTDAMNLVGMMFQDIVADLTKEFPESDNERIEAFVCPVPSIGATRRALSAVQRRLRDYTYMIGGTFTRCDNIRARRSLYDEVGVEAVCELAEAASLDAKVAGKISRQARAAFRKQTKQAMQCGDPGVREMAIATAEAFTKAIRKATRKTRTGASKAKKSCELAETATSEADMSEYMQQAQTASTNAIGVVRMAQSSYAEMISNKNVCNLGIETKDNEEDVTPVKNPGNENKTIVEDVTPLVSPVNRTESNEKDVTPLKDLLPKLAQKVEEKISERIVEESVSLGPECLGQGIYVNTEVDGVESLEDIEFWIGTIEDCTNVQ